MYYVHLLFSCNGWRIYIYVYIFHFYTHIWKYKSLSVSYIHACKRVNRFCVCVKWSGMSFFGNMSWNTQSGSHDAPLLTRESSKLANTKTKTGLHTSGNWKRRNSLASQGCDVCLFMRAKEVITCHCSLKKGKSKKKKELLKQQWLPLRKLNGQIAARFVWQLLSLSS